MRRTLESLHQAFESSSSETPQFRGFARTFKKEFTALLQPYTKNIQVSKGHFYLSGFFEMNDGRIYYFSLSDVRWFKDSMLLRSAKSFKDYTGGSNGSVPLDDRFETSLFRQLGIRI